MITHQCVQGTEEWIKLRLGIPTASMFSKIVTPKTGALSSQSIDYMALLLAEWISGAPVDPFENDWTRHGHEYEDEARRAYEFSAGAEVSQVGLITTDDGMIGASPDGLVGERGLCELKCPKANNHVAYMVSRAIDEKYRPQLQGQLWVCERDFVDIQSYCPGFPPVVVRVDRIEDYITKLSDSVRAFVDVMLETRARLEAEYGPFIRRVRVAAQDDYDGMDVTDEDIAQMISAGVCKPQGSR